MSSNLTDETKSKLSELSDNNSLEKDGSNPLETIIDEPGSSYNEQFSTISGVHKDDGWGWIVVFASFMCNVIVDGIIFSFGILLLEISRTFKQSKGTTAWIGSLQAGFYLVIGNTI